MSKRSPQPPWLRLGFYFSCVDEPDAFARVVRELVNLGAKPLGEATAYVGRGARSMQFDVYDTEFEPYPQSVEASTTIEFAAEELNTLLGDPDTLILELPVQNATGIVRDVIEVVAFTPVRVYEGVVDRHPIEIRTEAGVLGLSEPGAKSERRAAGQRTYERFRVLVERFEPDYASIGIEEGLATPTQLRESPRGETFIDFFVREDVIGHERLARLREIFEEAFVEPWRGGWYFSSWEFMNPAGSGAEDRMEKSRDAALVMNGVFDELLLRKQVK